MRAQALARLDDELVLRVIFVLVRICARAHRNGLREGCEQAGPGTMGTMQPCGGQGGEGKAARAGAGMDRGAKEGAVRGIINMAREVD